MRHLVRFVLSQQCPLSDNPPRHAIRLPHGQPDRPQMSLLFPPAASASKWAEKAQPLDIHFKHVKPIYIYILPHHPNTCLICLHLPGLSRNTSECNYMFVERSLGRNSSWKKKYLHYMHPMGYTWYVYLHVSLTINHVQMKYKTRTHT